jgi:hypothetical protein
MTHTTSMTVYVLTVIQYVLCALEISGALLVELGLVRLAHRVQDHRWTSKSYRQHQIILKAGTN